MFPYYQLTSTVFSCLLNVFLIFLIVRKSPKKLGNYKYLMIYTACFEMYYTILDALSDAKVFSHGFTGVVYHSPDSWLPHPLPMIFIIMYCSTFGMSMAVLGTHFVYRYSVTDNEFAQKFTVGWKLFGVCCVPFGYFIWWTCALLYGYLPDQETYDYLKIPFMEELDLPLENVSYVAPRFYRYADNGELLFNEPAWVAVSNSFMMVTSSVFCSLYLGVKCYLNIRKQLGKTSKVSKFSAKLQNDLFNALLVQTAIPVILLYIPIFIFFLLPMLNISIGYSSRLVSDLVTLYPLIDPLPNMFIIKSYRNFIFDMCCCCSKRVIQPENTRESNATWTVSKV